MKHTTLALVLAFTLAFGLVGCGRKDTNSDDMSGNYTPNSPSPKMNTNPT